MTWPVRAEDGFCRCMSGSTCCTPESDPLGTSGVSGGACLRGRAHDTVPTTWLLGYAASLADVWIINVAGNEGNLIPKGVEERR
jgi:hypothetical protein